MIVIRPERADDVLAIRAIHEAAFPTEAEAKLVDLLRGNGHAAISLVAEDDGVIEGHVLFSPVAIDGDFGAGGLGLAPVAVVPQRQGRGLGTRLIEAGLSECRRQQVPFVVVLGAPEFYQRFGFRRASDFVLRNVYGVDAEFMVLPLCNDALPHSGGLVTYGAEFSMFEE